MDQTIFTVFVSSPTVCSTGVSRLILRGVSRPDSQSLRAAAENNPGVLEASFPVLVSLTWLPFSQLLVVFLEALVFVGVH